MSTGNIIEKEDCRVGMPLEVVATGELLVVVAVEGTILQCKNLTTLLVQEYDLNIINLSGNLRKATEDAIRNQALLQLQSIRGNITEAKLKITNWESDTEATFNLLKLVREYIA